MSGKKNIRVCIIGGGASGMVAGITAGRNGAEVTILEKNPRVGKKILATGNGRCNLTNINIDISRYHGNHPEFVYGPFARFGCEKAIEFFEGLGIYHKVEPEGKVFPASYQSSSILDVLRYELDNLGVRVICETQVSNIRKGDYFEITDSDGRKFIADRVILAPGGKAGPEFGSDGSGYALAKKMGHRIVDPFPALVQLKLSSGFLKQIQGIKFNGTAEIISGGRMIRREAGEILFTDYGISGPPVLQLSRCASECLKKNEKVWIKVIMIDYLSETDLQNLLSERFTSGPDKPLSFSFVGFINKKLVPVILKEAGIEDINKPAAAVSSMERNSIARILQDWRFEITGTNPWSSAQVTAGGVDVKEIDSKTMESKLIPGLYFSGEIVDIDGDCGGYNLQWAWTSGYIAGESAAKAVE